MNKISAAFLILVSTLAGNLAGASDLFQFPKGPAAWTVEVEASTSPSANPAPPDPARVTKLDVTQDQEKRRIQITRASGAISAKFIITSTNAVLVKEWTGTVMGYPNSGDSGFIYGVPFLESAFAWIQPSALVEKDPISHGGFKCYHYKATVPDYELPNDNPDVKPKHTTHVAEAWIDSKTLKPVALDDGTYLSTYKFLPPPYPPVVIPPEFQATFNRLSH